MLIKNLMQDRQFVMSILLVAVIIGNSPHGSGASETTSDNAQNVEMSDVSGDDLDDDESLLEDDYIYSDADYQFEEEKGLYHQTIDVSVLTSEKNLLDIEYSNVTWNSNEPKHLPNLEELSIQNSQINPHSITFSDKLQSIDIIESKLIDGNISDLLKTATSLVRLRVEDSGDVDMACFPAQTLRTLDLYECALTSKSGQPVVFKNLERLKLFRIQFNPHYIIFGDKLEHLEISKSNLTNGTTVQGMLRMGTGLKHLSISNIADDMDISTLLSHNTLKHLYLDSERINCSSQIVFPNLKEFQLGQIQELDERTFCNFSVTFPTLRQFFPGESLTASPKAILSWLESPLRLLTFLFDLNPQIKSYEFGVIVKYMLKNGLSELIPKEFFLRPEDFPNSRFQRIWIYRTYLGDEENEEKEVCNSNSCITSIKVVTTDETILPWKYFGKEQVEIKPLGQRIVIFVYFFFLTTFFILGIFGNATSAFVLIRMKMKTSSGIILFSLTIYDSIVVGTYAMSSVFNAQLFYSLFVKPSFELSITEDYRQSVLKPTDHDWTAQRNWFLAFVIYPLNKTAYTGSVYTTVLISVERFIAICWPLKSRRLLSIRNSILSVLFVFLFSFLLNFSRWIESYEWNFYSETSLSWNEYYKPMLMRMETYRILYHGFGWSVTMYVLPFLIVGIINFRLGQQIISARRTRGTLQNLNSTPSRTKENEDGTSVTKMLLCVVFVFAICNSIHIAIVFYFILAYQQIELSTIEAVSCLPLIVNSSVNFIIYILMGKTLRTEFFKLVPQFIQSWFKLSTS